MRSVHCAGTPRGQGVHDGIQAGRTTQPPDAAEVGPVHPGEERPLDREELAAPIDVDLDARRPPAEHPALIEKGLLTGSRCKTPSEPSTHPALIFSIALAELLKQHLFFLKNKSLLNQP